MLCHMTSTPKQRRCTEIRVAGMIDFTAPQPGTLAFSCSMGMVRGSITVL